jgi:hypothetical protein
MWNQRDFYFTRFDEGITMGDVDWWNGVIPELIMEEITKRKYVSIIDAFPGPTTVLLAKYSKVITCEINQQKSEQILQNARVYGVADNIEIINGDFATAIKQHTARAVFFGPHLLSMSHGPSLDLTTAVQGFAKMLRIVAGCTDGMILYLPKNFDPE